MKKFLNILITTFIVFISLFISKNIVHAESSIQTCTYFGGYVFEVDRENNKVTEKQNGLYNENYGDHATSSHFDINFDESIIDDKCVPEIYVVRDEYKDGKTKKYEFWIIAPSFLGELEGYLTDQGHTIEVIKRELISDSGYSNTINCTIWDTVKNNYENRVNNALDSWNKLVAETASERSFVKHVENGWNTKPLTPDMSYSQIKDYLDYYTNTLNRNITSYIDSQTFETKPRVAYIDKELEKLYGELQGICDTESFKGVKLKLEKARTEIYKFNEAVATQYERLERINKEKKDLTEEEQKKLEEKTEEVLEKHEETVDYVAAYQKEWQINREELNTRYTGGCSIIGGNLKNFLNSILWYIKVFAIVLAIILSLLDYIKAASGADDKPMATANKKFMIRLILVVLLFLLPTLFEFLLNVLNIKAVDGTSIKCLR